MADLIDELVGMDDGALSTKLGFSDRVKTFKSDLARASKLTGKPRQKVVDHLTRMFTPSTYMAEDLAYTIDRAEKKANGETTPDEIVACGCGDPD